MEKSVNGKSRHQNITNFNRWQPTNLKQTWKLSWRSVGTIHATWQYPHPSGDTHILVAKLRTRVTKTPHPGDQARACLANTNILVAHPAPFMATLNSTIRHNYIHICNTYIYIHTLHLNTTWHMKERLLLTGRRTSTWALIIGHNHRYSLLVLQHQSEHNRHWI